MIRKHGGLGRGLDALLEASDPGIQSVAVEELEPNRFQPRAGFDDEGMAELADSIRRQGIVQPIIVTPLEEGRFTIVAGERRWRAARQAGLAEVPVVVREVSDDKQMLEMALVENLQRSDLNPVEEAEAFRSLQESFGTSQEEIGIQVGKSRAAVSNALRLLGFQDEILDLMRRGVLTAGQARPLLSIADSERRLELAEKAVREGLSARQLEALTKEDRKPRRKRAKTKALDPDTAAAQERLIRHLQTKVEIHRKGRGGSVRLHFHNEEELMRLFDLLLGVGGGS